MIETAGGEALQQTTTIEVRHRRTMIVRQGEEMRTADAGEIEIMKKTSHQDAATAMVIDAGETVTTTWVCSMERIQFL